MCGRHIRHVYQFGQSLVDEGWTEMLQTAVEDTATIEPAVAAGIESWVYFVRVGDLIKIGFSTYPAARFKTLRVDTVLAVMPGTRLDERRCHAAFQHLREHGEYFRPGPDLEAFIADLARQVS